MEYHRNYNSRAKIFAIWIRLVTSADLDIYQMGALKRDILNIGEQMIFYVKSLSKKSPHQASLVKYFSIIELHDKVKQTYL